MGAPWGWYQKILPIKNRLRERLCVLREDGLFKDLENQKPRADEKTGNPETKDGEKHSEIEIESQQLETFNNLSLKEVAKRQIALETFLKEFVLEIDYVLEIDSHRQTKNKRQLHDDE